MNKPFLSVVIPSYDEMANLQKGVLSKVANYLTRKKYSYEVIIVDDGSTDGSVKYVEDFVKENPGFRLIKNPHLGKAGAVTAGVLKSSGEYVLFTDLDQATPIEELDKMMPFLENNYDLVIGSRSNRRKNSPWTRIVMARGMIMLRSIIVGMKGISDTQCGFKVFKQSVAKTLFKKINTIHNGFQKVEGSNVSAGFDVELLYLAQKSGFSIKEVPVNWLYVESRRVSPLKDSIKGFLDLIRIKQNAIRGLYN